MDYACPGGVAKGGLILTVTMGRIGYTVQASGITNDTLATVVVAGQHFLLDVRQIRTH